MKEDKEHTDLEQLLAEAEELIQKINADVIEEMEEEHRLQFELAAQKFKKIKSKIGEKGKSKTGSFGGGMHEAILDILKSMREFAKYLT